MKTSLLFRILSLPIGLGCKLWDLAKDGSRDIQNRKRFKNSLIDNNCCINENSNIHANTHILSNCIINNSVISEYTYIGKNCIIQNTTIGKFCSIANGVQIGLGIHPTDLFSTSPLFYRKNNPLQIELIKENIEFIEYKPIVIGNDVWIGTNSLILDGVSIGDGAVIAAGAVVTKDVLPYNIVAGIPAKIIKLRFNQDRIEELLKSKWWDTPISEIIDQKNEI